MSAGGRVLTNTTSFAYAIESTEMPDGCVGDLPANPTWKQVEVNSPGNVGATITTVARNPISTLRQNRKGTITDLDSAFDTEMDLTYSHFIDFIEGFMFAKASGSEVFNPTSITNADTYNVSMGSALAAGTLIFARGFAESENNGLKTVTANSTATAIEVMESLTDTASVTRDATIETAGFQDTDIDVSVTNSVVTITSANNAFNSPGLNIQRGTAIYFAGFDTEANSGYAEVRSISATGDSIILTNTQNTWVSETSTGTVSFYIGRFIRNVSSDNNDFLERSFQFEISYPGLGSSGGTEYEYSRGNYCNTLAINMPLTERATISPSFVGTDTDAPTPTRKLNADQALVPLGTTAFNTTSDFARLRISNVDGTGLTTDFKSLTLNLNNNVSPEKVLGVLGARFMNYGNFVATAETQVLFTDSAVVEAIRDNATVTLTSILQNDDGAIYLHMPGMTLSGGNKDFPTDETVLINLTGNGFVDPVLNYTMAITVFPYIPS